MTLFARYRKLERRQRSSPAAMRGMTLLEIMVVITIIGVVMGAVAVGVIPLLGEAKVKTTKNIITTVETALKLYNVRHGKYPDTAQGIQILVSEKLVDKPPKDGWQNDLVYTLESGSKYLITSYGADGAPGGDGDDADITNVNMNEQK